MWAQSQSKSKEAEEKGKVSKSILLNATRNRFILSISNQQLHFFPILKLSGNNQRERKIKEQVD